MSDFLEEGHPDWGWEFGMEDFVRARLEEERAQASKLAGVSRVEALHKVDHLWKIMCWHSIYVGDDGRSWARCFTCQPTCGVPCSTMRALTGTWRNHIDFRVEWEDSGAYMEDVFAAGSFRRAYLTKRAARESEEGSS